MAAGIALHAAAIQCSIEYRFARLPGELFRQGRHNFATQRSELIITPGVRTPGEFPTGKANLVNPVRGSQS